MIIALEVIETFSLVGRNDVTDVLLGMDITDTGGWNVLQDLVADGMNQVGFSKADAAEQVKRIVGNARIVGYLNGRSRASWLAFPVTKLSKVISALIRLCSRTGVSIAATL